MKRFIFLKKRKILKFLPIKMVKKIMKALIFFKKTIDKIKIKDYNGGYKVNR